MGRVRFVDLPAQYRSIAAEIDDEIKSILTSARFIGGQPVRRFEESFADYQQVRFCVGVGNGTDALEIALDAVPIRCGGEIIVPANSFIASSEAVSRSGYRVVFADVNCQTYLMGREQAEAVLTEDTVAIMPVHLYGQPAPMEDLMALARERGIVVVEDAAQAHGAEYRQARVGGMGVVGTFSFYPGKNLGAYGDAGAIVTNDEELATRARMTANHGRSAKYHHRFEGRNSRMDSIQAAILSVKLRHLEDWTEHRRRIADRYLQGLADLDELTLPTVSSDVRHVYHLFVVRCPSRDRLRAWLSDRQIETGIHYPVALPDLEAYANSHPEAHTPVARRLAGEILSLPMNDQLSLSQVDFVTGAIREFFGKR